MPVDDYLQARERMRRLRAQQGGMTVYDRARNYALLRLRKQYPEDFEWWRQRYLNEHQRRAS